MNTPLTYSVADIREDMRVKYTLDTEHFGVGTVVDTYTEPLGFVLFDKYNGTHDVEASAILEVLWDVTVGAPFTQWTGGGESAWVKVVTRPINWDDMGSSERDLWEERVTRATFGAKR